jgi:hypothetical protein
MLIRSRSGIAAVLALALLGACAAGGGLAPDPRTFEAGVAQEASAVRSWRVGLVIVDVSRNLSVSQNPDTRFPGTDIVWWEDAPGDRHAQVAEVMREAVRKAVEPLKGPNPVTVNIRVNRFHALTPDALKNGTRGWHDVNFDIEVRDSSGKVIAAEKSIDADIKALQGAASDAALANGETQRSRIATRVSLVIRNWLGIS